MQPKIHITRDNTLQGEKSPIDLITPEFIGQTYVDSKGVQYIAYGVTNKDWSCNQPKQDLNLKTTSKDTTGAINELLNTKRGVKDKITRDDLETSHNSKKIGLVNLSDEVIQAMVGDTPVHSIIEDGSITNEKYANRSISENKLSFLNPVTTVNLFDPKEVHKGYYTYTDGNFNNSNSFGHSWYSCEPGDVFRATHPTKGCHVSFWTEDKVFIKGMVNFLEVSVVAPANCYWVCFTHRLEDTLDTQMIVKNNHLPEKFIPKELYEWDDILLGEKSVTKDNLDFVNKTTTYNLVDPRKIRMNMHYDYTDGRVVNSHLYMSSDFIPVEQGKTYYTSFSGHVTFWDTKKNFVEGLTGKNYVTVNNSEIAYAVFTFKSSDTKFMVHEGSSALPYLPRYYYTLQHDISIDFDDVDKFIQEKHINDNVINVRALKGNIGRNNVGFYKNTTENLLDLSSLIYGGYFEGVSGKWVKSSSYDSSHYIEIEPNTTYVCGFNSHNVFLDENKNYISSEYTGDTSIFTTPENCKYVIKPIPKNISPNSAYIIKGTSKILPTEVPKTKFKDELLLVDSSNISDKCINPNHTDFIIKTPTVNLFDRSKAYKGYYDFNDGGYRSSSAHMTTGLLELEPNTRYTCTYHGHVVHWNSKKQKIKGENIKSTVTPGLDMDYKYTSFTLSSDKDTHMIVKGSEMPSEFIPPYYYSLDEEKIKLSVHDYFSLQRTRNLYNKDTWSHGYNHWEDGRFLNDTATFGQSDFIEVEEGKTYKVVKSVNCYVTYWNANKTFVSGVSSGTKFTIPTGRGIKYIRAVVRNVNKDVEMILPNDVSSSKYIPYEQITLSESIRLPQLEEGTNKLSKLKWAVLGDSITTLHYGGTPYWKHIEARTGMTVYNHGISGSRIARTSGRSDEMCVRYANMEDEADIITIFGGTNDYASSVPLGDINSTDINTFKGALNVLIEGLINKYPGKGIGYIIPMRRRGMTNASNKAKFESYVNAIIEVCEKYSIPYLDLYRQGGLNPDINAVNSQFFHNQDGLHPNNDGHARLSNKIEQFILGL